MTTVTGGGGIVRWYEGGAGLLGLSGICLRGAGPRRFFPQPVSRTLLAWERGRLKEQPRPLPSLPWCPRHPPYMQPGNPRRCHVLQPPLGGEGEVRVQWCHVH